MRDCALKHARGKCHGGRTWHHVIPQQRIKRQFPDGAWRLTSPVWRPVARGDEIPDTAERRTLRQILRDARNRVWLCPFHHGQVEQKKLRVVVPDSVRVFAVEFGMEWSLESDERKAVA